MRPSFRPQPMSGNRSPQTIRGCLAAVDGMVFFGLDYSAGTSTIIPGGTLPAAGTLDMTGLQNDHHDRTATVSIAGSYTCEDLAA